MFLRSQLHAWIMNVFFQSFDFHGSTACRYNILPHTMIWSLFSFQKFSFYPSHRIFGRSIKYKLKITNYTVCNYEANFLSLINLWLNANYKIKRKSTIVKSKKKKNRELSLICWPSSTWLCDCVSLPQGQPIHRPPSSAVDLWPVGLQPCTQQ